MDDPAAPSQIERARAERFAAELLDAFVANGATSRDLRRRRRGNRRGAARRVAHEHGRYVVTGYDGPADELVWARLYDHRPTSAERPLRAAIDEALVIAGGQVLSRELLD